MRETDTTVDFIDSVELERRYPQGVPIKGKCHFHRTYVFYPLWRKNTVVVRYEAEFEGQQYQVQIYDHISKVFEIDPGEHQAAVTARVSTSFAMQAGLSETFN